MSMPNIPNVDPNINITYDQAASLVLSSIAFEELGLAHVINAEAEKIQYVLGTLDGSKPAAPPTIEQLIRINCTVKEMLDTVAKNQLLLNFELDDTIKFCHYK